MNRGIQGADHVWLVMMKAMRALTRYAAAGIEETGLGLSDFGVLEALLHKGPLPVNTIGPIVDLIPGSISIAVDRLVAKGLVSRVESAEVPDIHLGIRNRTEHVVHVHSGQAAVRDDHSHPPQPGRMDTREPAAVHPFLIRLLDRLHVPAVGQASPAVVLFEGSDPSFEERLEFG